MNNFFEKLTFKQKIIFGFTLLSVILILGMGYMLFEFNKISQLSKNIIEKQQPIIRSSSNAIENSKSAANHIHKFLLNGETSSLKNYFITISELKNNLSVLIQYASNPEFDLSMKELQRTDNIVEEINDYVYEIEKFSNNYEENHPVINSAASTLNPLALEYLGLLNYIIEENKVSSISKEVLLRLSDMRHSWTQMMSSLRVTLATRQAREFVNVKAYADVNLKQMNSIKKLKLDLGLEGVEELEKIRNEYMIHLAATIAKFNTKIWRMDAHIMTSKVMPLFDEMNMCLDNLSNSQLKQQEIADRLLAQKLKIAHYSYIALIFISFVIAFTIAVFITRSLRKPLLRLVDASNEVAKGNFGTGILVVGDDEISNLSKSFNDMVNKLQESQSALTKAKDIAEHANKIKSEFLTRMSHELRTPLNAILGFAQILDMESNDNNYIHKKQHIKNILKSGSHLLDLVEELLDLSQIETNTILIKNEEKDIYPIIKECIEISRSMTNDSDIEILEYLRKDVSCYANIDPVRFKQVILNLLTNAIKYNSEGGKVTVKCELSDDKSIKISICDEGAGLTKAEVVRVFDAFQRLDADRHSISGIGVGLNIAKNLVELMHGKIGVESKEGQGSCFWIEFPIIDIVTKIDTPEPVLTSDSKTADKRDSYNILYVEDDEFNLELVREVITIMCPEDTLYEATTAEEGFDIIKDKSIDLILMDINLPGMSGYEALIKLKANKETEDIPVVAVSADAVKESISTGKAYGFEEYITKPINIDHFVEVINSILDNENKGISVQ